MHHFYSRTIIAWRLLKGIGWMMYFVVLKVAAFLATNNAEVLASTFDIDIGWAALEGKISQ